VGLYRKECLEGGREGAAGSAGVRQTTNIPVIEEVGGEIYVNLKTCKRPARRLTALSPPIDGQAGVGVPFLSAEARSGCGYMLDEDEERYQDRIMLGGG
jgi:hypothetical protein